MVNILDLARPDTSEAAPEVCHDDIERAHQRKPMTTLDHAICAICLVACIVLWPVVGTVIVTLLHLHGLASLVVTWLWPFAFAPPVFIIMEVLPPLRRLLQRNAERIEGYND